MHRIAIKLASRSALRSLESSARQPDFRILVSAMPPTPSINRRIIDNWYPPIESFSLHTCQLNDVDPFHYLTELQRHAKDVADHPEKWMPWSYRESVADTQSN